MDLLNEHRLLYWCVLCVRVVIVIVVVGVLILFEYEFRCNFDFIAAVAAADKNVFRFSIKIGCIFTNFICPQ